MVWVIIGLKRLSGGGSQVKSIYLTPFKSKTLPNKLYRFYNNEKELKTAFNLGEINQIENLFDLGDLYLSRSTRVEEDVLENVYLGVFFNTLKSPFTSKTFRQALAYATPKGEEGRERALSPINPLSWTYNPDVKPYTLDLEHAKSLLDKEKPPGGYPKVVINTLPQHEQTASRIADSWRQAGIQTEVKITSFVPEDFEALVVAREIPPDPDQYYFWHSTQPGNIAKFKSPRIDKLLEDGRKTLDQDERQDIYFDFQRFLVEESPVIFLEHPLSYTVIRD